MWEKTYLSMQLWGREVNGGGELQFKITKARGNAFGEFGEENGKDEWKKVVEWRQEKVYRNEGDW